MRTVDHPPIWSDPSDIRSLARRSGLVAARCDVLTRDLPAAIDSLWRRGAWEVPEGHLDACGTSKPVLAAMRPARPSALSGERVPTGHRLPRVADPT